MYNILICDDDPDIVAALTIYLSGGDYTLFEAHNGQEALALMERQEIHLILMDIMMPRLDGLTATAKLRERFNVPILLLTAKAEEADKLLGLNLGADDYITKPFSPMEVLARVRSHLRRYTRLGGMPDRPERLVLGGVELDDEARSVTVDGEPVSLTPTEYAILRLLMQHPGRVFSSGEIYAKVSGGAALAAEGAVAVHIRHIREKIEIDPSNPRYLRVVWGQGYRMEGERR